MYTAPSLSGTYIGSKYGVAPAMRTRSLKQTTFPDKVLHIALAGLLVLIAGPLTAQVTNGAIGSIAKDPTGSTPPKETQAVTVAMQSACTVLLGIRMAHSTITSAVVVPAGPFKIDSPGRGPSSINLPSFCRVQGVIKPTGDSNIKLEVWMPVSDWNGNFEQIGNGGYAGDIAYSFMAPELLRGFAIASTDDGHTSGTDQSWAIGHPEKVIDFGYRAVHETSVQAKIIVQAFYGKGASYSYFDGCSDGGREGLMEAQRFPLDFNGIVAGAPANFWTHLMVGNVWDEQAFLNNPASYIPLSKISTIQAVALAACDALDGVKDGIVEDPRLCHFNPAVLLCKGTDDSNCLTAAQVEAATKIYSGPRNPRTGKQIFPGYEPGAEAAIGDWPTMLIGRLPKGGRQFSLGNMFFSDMIFENTTWNFHTLNFASDVALTDAKLASILNSTNPDLRQFKAHGGKLIQYHGWADTSIAPLNSINYYQSAVRKMGGLKRTQAFYRLYMVPGMSHCAGGPGPNSFGGIIQDRLPQANPENDVVDALTQWVEHGVAPGKIIATKFNDDNPSKGILMTRPLCPYPAKARWTGRGSTSDSANFICK